MNAEAWGEVYGAYGEVAQAQRAFIRTLAVRQRIRYPGIKEIDQRDVLPHGGVAPPSNTS